MPAPAPIELPVEPPRVSLVDVPLGLDELLLPLGPEDALLLEP